MSANKEKIFKTLALIGLLQTEAEIYLQLTIAGPQQTTNIATALNMPKHRVHRSLKNLKDKKFVSKLKEHPMRFLAAPLEEVLDLYKMATLEEAERMEEIKEKTIKTWRQIAEKRESG